MLIGILSDTHDCLPMVKSAVEQLNENTIDLVLHAGDYVAPFVIPVLAGLDAPLIGVFGNNDGDHALLLARCAEYDNLQIRGTFAGVTAGGLSIGLLHGQEQDLLRALMERGTFDVLVHGHSHKAEITRRGAMLVINPGEVCGYLTGRPTVAVLDTDDREATLVQL
ncbi:MAG TPA: metallophosphoesterase [Methanolinea sp.]|nr:metallophosphoesterase [Methanolinea sp.]